jgi:membrane protein involved in colicin uptake
MKNSKMMMLTLPFLLGGCLTDPMYTRDGLSNQSRTRAQSEQTQIQVQQKQKIIQKNKSQTINVNQYYKPYPIYSEAQRRADERAGRIQQPAGRRAQRAEYYRQQDELNRQARAEQEIQARQMALARQNSLATAAQEEARRQDLAAQEARDIEQAKQNSLVTNAQEEARRQAEQGEAARNGAAREIERQREEARQIEQATQESLRTYAQEEANRQQAAAAQSQAVVSSTSVVTKAWEPNSGHLVRAGELVMELKRDNGGNTPSHGAMVDHIQSKMALSPVQAELVLQELGI